MLREAKQRRITIITQAGDVIIEFQELKENRHNFISIYYTITEVQELAQLGQAFYEWCSGVDASKFDIFGLRISEND